MEGGLSSTLSNDNAPPAIAVVIPCYKVKEHVLEVINRCGSLISQIICVDDCCPEGSGKFIQQNCQDSRVKVIFNKQNLGVGGATIAGWREAVRSKASIVVKIDGDGQMDPQLIPSFVGPIAAGLADYTKGNRFFRLESLSSMPLVRLFGNAVLSFLTKAGSGYWDLMDPTNGYTAISSQAIKLLPLEKIDPRYFFESDVLFRLNTIRAVVKEIPMDSQYGAEQSNLKIFRDGIQFPFKLLRCLVKRIFYCHFLRGFNVCSVQLILGLGLMLFGLAFGSMHWYLGSLSAAIASPGTVMLAALPVILGLQLILAAINYDVQNIPTTPISMLMRTGQAFKEQDKDSQAQQNLSLVIGK